MRTVSTILNDFRVLGTVVDILNDVHGFINDTFIVTLRDQGHDTRYVLQRVNHRVFKCPEDVMGNLRVISDHLKFKSQGSGSTIKFAEIVQTWDGRDFLREEDGDVWRLITYIEHAKAYDTIQGVWHAEECGKVLGRFLDLVSDIDVSQIKTTIPGYHVPSEYLRLYDEAPKGELPQEMASFVDRYRNVAVELEKAEADGVLKKRIIHGDPRLNNIMIDERTGRGVAMIDLDTASAGLVQMDIGDAVRSICNPAGEDVQSLDDVSFRMDVYRAFMKGFYSTADHFLTAEDKAYIVKAVKILPFELGLRFLTDHLKGDGYFKVQYHGQNLKRAMGQFKLCELVQGIEE